jgi:hypothetical protein
MKTMMTILALGLALSGQAQYSANGTNGQGGTVEAYDKEGRPMTISNNGRIEGTPLLCPDWCTGSVLFTNGRSATPILLRFDLEKNLLYFQQEGKFYRFTDTVSAFSMMVLGADSITRPWKFRNGYEREAKKHYDTYYQVLEEGPRAHLLYHTYASLVDKYAYGGPEKQGYQLHQDLFLFDFPSGKLTKLKSGGGEVMNALPSSHTEVEAWLKGHSKGSLNRDDIIQLVRSLNSTAL